MFNTVAVKSVLKHYHRISHPVVISIQEVNKKNLTTQMDSAYCLGTMLWLILKP